LTWTRSSIVTEGILAGSQALEREFVEHFTPRLAVFFRARSPLLEIAEELTQETLLASLLALRAGKLRDCDAVGSFVLGIARRQLAEAFRSKARHPVCSAAELEDVHSGPAPAQELTLTVRNEFYNLGEMDQRILWLILVEGHRPAEVAAQVGLSEDAVRQRKSRALRRLAEKLNTSAVTNTDWLTTLKQSGSSDSKP